MKKFAVLAVASLGLWAGDVAAQGGANRQPGSGAGAQQPDPNAVNQPPRRPRGDRPPPTTAPLPAPQPQRQPSVVQQPRESVPQPRQWGGRPRGGDAPVVVQQPRREPGWGGGRPNYDAPVYRPGPGYRPDYRPDYRPAPPVVVVPGPSYGPPPQWRHRRSYDWCRAKAERLHHFEWLMQQDGRVSKDEARIARNLRADLSSSCGGGRWAPNRGWYYG